jgi:hypothetical protein
MHETLPAKDTSTPPLQVVLPTVPSRASRLPPIRALGQARRPREDGPRRDVTKQTNKIKSATGRTQDKTKTKKLVEFGCVGRDSDDSDAELSGENDDTSHAEAPSDSTYCEGD